MERPGRVGATARRRVTSADFLVDAGNVLPGRIDKAFRQAYSAVKSQTA
jgi:hypothetical protein